MSAFLADVIVVVHFGIVLFCIAGEIMILLGAASGWRWIRNLTFRLLHLGMVLFVAAEALLGIICPLTEWEYDLRLSAGQEYEEGMSFVARIIRKIIFYEFPAWVFTALYVGFGLLVLLTLILVRPHRK
ncbi:MAG: hypothetical protein A2Z99_02435 [Treponema sp. GWB1_62_6]|nr:MAG: hypothetical protein A2Z99_02435 [Treponema sp. GWB1_62_6]OHE69494.1 MAG: hypothetical protein A2001_19975 [Treponema sp. GWC1_61_84]OHE72485.1 MAG: hypothetical protein A2413_14085 [Treponema sp. RIFOXYC1_FULL_61_9]HCM24967.1 DUF2784 domain-containing protein [Treponema sp.]